MLVVAQDLPGRLGECDGVLEPTHVPSRRLMRTRGTAVRFRPVHVVRAPGRVNLIGDHTDYQDGFCLPVAIDREVVVRAVARTDGIVVARSDALEGIVEIPADGYQDPSRVVPKWGRSVAGVLRLLSQPDRPAVGFDADVTSTVPVGSGPVVERGVRGRLCNPRRRGERLLHVAPGRRLDRAGRRAGGDGCAVRGDGPDGVGVRARRPRVAARLPQPRDHARARSPTPSAIVVVHTGSRAPARGQRLRRARAACEAAATRLGVETLRDATIEQVADDPIARHVVSENQRVLAFVDALRAGDLDRCGRLMDESHASLRDDFRVSTPELDALVDALVDAAAYGARLTGAGFGGCAVALVPSGAIDEVVTQACSRYVSATGLTPMPLVVRGRRRRPRALNVA